MLGYLSSVATNDKLTAGMVLGRYELLLPIAQGGMATVWAARQKGSRGFQKTVAVKTMLPNLSDDPQFEQMFLDEASLAARIHHPNVAEILDLGEQDDILYLVMEWIDGEALSVIHKTAKKNNTHLPQRIALRMIAQACAGLHAAHELKDENDQSLGLVHRDVSPQNILVTYDGIVKLVDFGVAKAIGRAGGETTAGQLKGKVPYMSPEQARGGQVDRRTDVFAMGIVLYKLATGLHPFLGENDLITMRNIITRPVLPPRVKNPDFSPELEQVLLKALHKDADKRYQTIADLDRAIDRVLAVTGASVVDDDVGSFVRAIMGDRGQKRRAALRDAVRAADERAAGIALTPGPVVHEAISDVLLTKMASGVKEEMLPERLSLIGGPSSGDPNRTTSENLAAASAGEAPASLFDIPQPPRNNRGILVAAAAGAAVALVLAFVLLGRGGGGESAAQTGSAVAPVQPAPAPPPTVAAEVQPAATTAPTTAVDEPAVSINDLPNAADKTEKSGGAKRRPGGAAPAKDKDDDKAPAGAATPPKQGTSKTWVPSVQNPGF